MAASASASRTERTPLLRDLPAASRILRDQTIHGDPGGLITPDIGTATVQATELPNRRQIGLFSAAFIILNRMIGTGVFATPSMILALSGSVGLALTTWLVGALIASAGMIVYIVWGTAIPRNGGEKNYIEYLIRQPRYLASSAYAVNAAILGWAAGNSVVCGEYILRAANQDNPGQWTRRLIGFGAITIAFILHGTSVRTGLYVQNILGASKLILLVFVAATGLYALKGPLQVEKPDNFSHIWEGTTASMSSFCLSLYNVIWCYLGFGSVNYVLSETKDPKRTIRIAGPTAIAVITALYLVINIGYFAAASKHEITHSGRLVAALLFRNVYGPRAERVLSVFVALSSFGNVMAVLFGQGRVNQVLAREGIFPFSQFFGSNKPFNAPLAGLGLHWFACVVTIFALPPGDAYSFIINTISYPFSVNNATIAFGIIYLHFRPYRSWQPASRLSLLAAAFFGIANVFLIVVPFTRPPPGKEPYKSLPYWAHAAAGLSVYGLGTLYWLMWANFSPWLGGYTLVRRQTQDEDGVRYVFEKVKKGHTSLE